MKKPATKSAVKAAIKSLITDTASKVVKLARSNGFEIVMTHFTWNNIVPEDLEDYESARQMMDDVGVFAEENLESLINIVDDVDTKKLELASRDDINRFIKEFNTKKAEYNKENADAKSKRIAYLNETIAKAQKELKELMAK